MITEKIHNKIIIISSPSGAGKTTICKYLLKKIKNLELSVSYTTRKQRINENNGKDYFFVDKYEFQKLKNKNFFIETAKNFNSFYGSPYSNINKSFKKNKNILFDIDWKGARKLRKKFPKNQIIDFFILPPSKIELEKRLKKRGRDDSDEIKMRLSYALTEISHHNEYKHILINDKIQDTVKYLTKIIDYNTLISSLDFKVSQNLKKLK